LSLPAVGYMVGLETYLVPALWSCHRATQFKWACRGHLQTRASGCVGVPQSKQIQQTGGSCGTREGWS